MSLLSFCALYLMQRAAPLRHYDRRLQAPTTTSTVLQQRHKVPRNIVDDDKRSERPRRYGLICVLAVKMIVSVCISES